MYVLDPDERNEFIATGSGVAPATVAVVIAVEEEYMYGVGIMEGPEPSWQYYTADELKDRSREIDPEVLAVDVHERAGIPVETALLVFDWETRYLQHVGLA